jgi:hypothetical protein
MIRFLERTPGTPAVLEVEAPRVVAVAEEPRAVAAVEEPRAEVGTQTGCTVAVVAWPSPVAPAVIPGRRSRRTRRCRP